MSELVKHHEYKDTSIAWLGPVPSHWSVVRSDALIGVITMLVGPDALNGKPVSHYSIPVVQSTGTFQVENGDTVDSSKWVINRDVVLVSKLNPRKSTICRARPQAELTVCSTEFVPMFSKGDLDLDFLTYLVQSENNRQRLSALVTSATRSHQRVNPSEVRKFWFAKPPLSEQRAIASFLDHETNEIDEFIKDQGELIALLNERRTATITQAVTKGLDPNTQMQDSGIEWVGKVPKHWKIRKLKALSRVISKGTTPTTMGESYTDEGVRFLRGEDIQSGRLVSETPRYISEETHKLLSRSNIQEGDILFVIAGTLGKTAIATADVLPCNTNQAIAFIRLNSPSQSKFIHYWLSSRPVEEMTALGAVIAAQPNLSMATLGNFVVPVPTDQEMHRIVNFLDYETAEIDAAIADAQESIGLSKERRAALISAAVTGKIDVRNHAAVEGAAK